MAFCACISALQHSAFQNGAAYGALVNVERFSPEKTWSKSWTICVPEMSQYLIPKRTPRLSRQMWWKCKTFQDLHLMAALFYWKCHNLCGQKKKKNLDTWVVQLLYFEKGFTQYCYDLFCDNSVTEYDTLCSIYWLLSILSECGLTQSVYFFISVFISIKGLEEHSPNLKKQTQIRWVFKESVHTVH